MWLKYVKVLREKEFAYRGMFARAGDRASVTVSLFTSGITNELVQSSRCPLYILNTLPRPRRCDRRLDAPQMSDTDMPLKQLRPEGSRLQKPAIRGGVGAGRCR